MPDSDFLIMKKTTRILVNGFSSCLGKRSSSCLPVIMFTFKELTVLTHNYRVSLVVTEAMEPKANQGHW